MSRVAVKDALKAQLVAAGLTVVVDDPRVTLPGVVITPPGIESFYEVHETWISEERTHWGVGLYSVPTFEAADGLLESFLDALRVDDTLGGTVVRVMPSRVEIPLRQEPEGNNAVRYRRLVVLTMEHDLGA